ncbi:MAG: Mur ligase domain-containing protein [Calditrichia bacterium]
MKYYFLGICGTAIASLAVLLKQKGHEVWGTDQNVYPPRSDFLKLNNIRVREGYDIANLRSSFDKAIIGNALSRGNPEVEEILNRRLLFASLPEMIRQEFAQSLKSVVITGTHGKTTTTALMSWILEEGGTFAHVSVRRHLTQF